VSRTRRGLRDAAEGSNGSSGLSVRAPRGRLQTGREDKQGRSVLVGERKRACRNPRARDRAARRRRRGGHEAHEKEEKRGREEVVEGKHLPCPLSTGRGTRRVRSVKGKGRGVSAEVVEGKHLPGAAGSRGARRPVEAPGGAGAPSGLRGARTSGVVAYCHGRGANA